MSPDAWRKITCRIRERNQQAPRRIKKGVVTFEFLIQLSLRQDLPLTIMVLVGFCHLQLKCSD